MVKHQTRSKEYDDFVTELVMAIDKYGEEHVDIIIDTENDSAYLSYHSTNNSFNISENYPLSPFNFISIADNFNVGWSEI